MKILLVNPPDTHSLNCCFGNTPKLHVYSPPLGLMYIKSYLLKRLEKAEIRLFNFQVPGGLSHEDFVVCLKEFQPEVVGISVMTFFWYDTCEVARTVKMVVPDAKVIGGGPHMWHYPQESLISGGFDVIVQGEGEVAFFEILTGIESGQSLSNILGIVYKNNDGTVAQTGPRLSGKDNVDELPFPDRSDFCAEQYRSIENNGRRTVVAIASRGCPYQCAFCNNHERIFRPRRPDLVVAELLECRNMGYQAVMFYDDVFTCSREHAVALCERMINEKLNMPWICQTRVDCIDQDLVPLMFKAGCERIQMGVESGNQVTLDIVDKGITLEKSRKAFALCKGEGLETVAYFMIGFPGETPLKAKKTFAFAEELDADYVICTPLIPIPGTKMHQMAMTDPAFDGDWWRRYIMNPSPDYVFHPWLADMSEREAIELINSFYRRYYLSPRRIVKHFRKLKGPGDFLVKAQAGMKILFGR